MSLTETIRVQVHEDYFFEIRKYRGSYGEYYSVNDVNYDIHFPIDWVFQIPENVNKFGPETCYDCFINGYYKGVFIGYCVDCASFCNYERGNGLIHSIERQHALLDDKNSIWNLYLQIVSLEEIGDRQLQIDYDYKVNAYSFGSGYIQKLYNDNDNDNDDITVTYNDSFGYYSEKEDDNTITLFSYDDLDLDLDLDLD
jgi:hypothetical protein